MPRSRADQAHQIVLDDYVHLLGRLPETIGINYWSELLLNKNWLTQQVAGAIAFSPEGIIAQQTQDITSLYLALLNRAPDLAGLKYWTDIYHQGEMSLNQIAEEFGKSPEGKAIYPSTMSNAEAVIQLYSTLFLTQPTADQVNNYVDSLNSGISFSSLATSLAIQYRAGSLINPAATLENQVFLNFLQTTHIGDPSYDAAASLFYLPEGGIYDIASVFDTAIPSPAFAAPNKLIDAISNNSTQPMSMASVGSTAKAYIGTPANDTWDFNPATWNSGNNFEGRGGYDTINLNAFTSITDYVVRGISLKGIEAIYLDAGTFGPSSVPTGLSISQGFQTDNNEALDITASSDYNEFNIKLRWTGTFFNQRPELSATDVNAPGEWYILDRGVTTRFNTILYEVTYFDSINQRAQDINILEYGSGHVANYKVIGGDLTFWHL